MTRQKGISAITEFQDNPLYEALEDSIDAPNIARMIDRLATIVCSRGYVTVEKCKSDSRFINLVENA